MDTTERIRKRVREGDEGRAALLVMLRERPGDTHEVISALTCDRKDIEAGAAEALVFLAGEAPELLEPFARRLFRIAAGSEHQAVRLAIARALPLLELGAWQAGRLAFVFESWLDDRDPAIKRAAMEALVALVPQRPSLGPRVRREIERRAAEGSPTAIKHGTKLLETLREF